MVFSFNSLGKAAKMVVCRMSLVVYKKKIGKIEYKIKWWKLK